MDPVCGLSISNPMHILSPAHFPEYPCLLMSIALVSLAPRLYSIPQHSRDRRSLSLLFQ